MKVVSFLATATLICAAHAQVQYVPAQLLVPVLNASGFNVANHTWYNNSRPNYGWNVPSYGGHQNAPNNTNYGWNVPNYGSQNGYRPYYKNGSAFNTTNTTAVGNVMIGTIGLYDRLLFTKVYEWKFVDIGRVCKICSINAEYYVLQRIRYKEYYKSGRWWSSREKIIEYPKDIASGYLRHETIHALRIYNLLYNGKKARAQILSGGVGRQYVKIRLSSDWREGFKFLVQIYGQ